MTRQINLLGSPSIFEDGQPSELTKSNKGIALLSYLIVRGRSETREHLADLLWDSSDTSASLRNLRVLLSRVRPHLPNLDAIQNSVRYDPGPDETVDYLTLSGKLSNKDTPISLDDLLLYRGELLENFYLEDAPRFMEWLTVEQEKFRLRVLDAHRNLCQKLADEKRWREGGETAAHWLSIDEMDEEAIRYQLQFMATAGQVAAALKAYSAFKKNL